MSELSGLKVLVVEDEGAVALLIEEMLEDLGCKIAASTARFAQACRIAATADIDLAVLDINLDGQPAFPIAEILRERQIPFLFSTGYGKSGLPHEFTGQPVIGKPFSMAELQKAIASILRR